MNRFLRRTLLAATLLAALSGIALALAGCGGGGGSSNPPGALAPTEVVQPWPLPGPFAVACSNVVQDFSRLAPGEDATSYWEGAPSGGGTPRYATDLLADPGNTLIATVTAPQDSNLYGSFAGDNVAFVVLACYPTTDNNPRPDYPLPNGKVVPHMQIGSDAPIFADPSARYPVVVFSHGYTGSPISGDYISGLSVFASYGYVVIAPFHGDLRFSDLTIDNLSDAYYRALALEQLHGDAGAATAFDLRGARPRPRASAMARSHRCDTDRRIRCEHGRRDDDAAGRRRPDDLLPRVVVGIRSPAIRGSRRRSATCRISGNRSCLPSDATSTGSTASICRSSASAGRQTRPLRSREMKIGMSRLTGTRELVALSGVQHGFDNTSTNDIFTWTLTFLDAEVRGNPATQTQLSTMASVAGGGDDSVVIFYNGLP